MGSPSDHQGRTTWAPRERASPAAQPLRRAACSNSSNAASGEAAAAAAAGSSNAAIRCSYVKPWPPGNSTAVALPSAGGCRTAALPGGRCTGGRPDSGCQGASKWRAGRTWEAFRPAQTPPGWSILHNSSSNSPKLTTSAGRHCRSGGGSSVPGTYFVGTGSYGEGFGRKSAGVTGATTPPARHVARRLKRLSLASGAEAHRGRGPHR
mmetsp:Transcript_105329/g.335289  ORF Transcript_105329/g.335289 Transcript_105329/m.335289 type:complete len:208 (-) Transcript_105329:268-891(-)